MSTSTEYVKKHNRNVCSFTGCRRNKSRCPTLRFFSFPVNRPNICDLWVQNCANESLETVPKKTLNNKVVCEKHFEKDCFSSPILKHRLHASAIPTILPLQDDEPDPTPTLNEEMNVDVTPENSVEIPQPQTNELPDAADHSREALFSSPRSTNSSIPDYKTLQSIKGHAENLEEEKQETLAMRYKSPASYEQMRSDGFALPSTSTMPARWLQAVDLRPGACIEIMKIVRNELHHMADGKKDAVILFDEMSIKTSLDYDSKKDIIEGAMAEKINERLQIPISQEEKIHRLKKYENIEDVLKQNLKCTVCCADLSGNIITRNSCKLHSHLKVLVCKKCKAFYADGNFSTDEDGGPKYCRWCGDGGHMFLCDKCNNGFCKPCVRRNFSRNYFQKVNTGDRWSCFMCSPEVLYDLRATAWAARELCRKRQEEENRNGKYHRRKKYSSLEESFTSIRGQDNLNATLDETRPDQNRNTIEKNPDLREVKVKISHPNPNTKSRKGFYKNPVLLQAREEMKKFFSQLVKLHENDRFLEMKNEILSDNDCEDFLYIEKLELMVQDFIICFIEELNRFSNDLSSRLTQLQRMYMIEEDLARRNGGFEGGDQEHDSDQENIIEKCDGMQSKQDNLVEDDAISLSMSVSSEISCFSSVSNSRHNTDVVEGRLNAENVFDSDDSSSRTDFSLANIGSTSTPSKGKEKLNEVINNMDAICEEDEEQEEEEERLKGDDDEEVVKTLLKLLDDDDIDGDEEDDRGEEEEDEGEKEDDLAEKEGGYASIEKGGVVEEEKRGEILRGGGGEEEGTAVSQEDGGENGGEEGDDDDDDEDKKNRNEKRINFFPNSSSDGESENMEDDKTHASNCEKASIKDGGDKVEDEDDRDWEDIKRLTNLGALERKRKHSSSESGDDNEPRKTTKEKSITKKPKKSEDKYDILENLTDKEGNEDSNNTDEDDDFCIKNFGKSFKKSEPSGFDSKLWLSDYAENSENHSSSTEGGSEKEGTCKMEDEGKKESKKENRTTDSSDSEVKTKRPRKRASWRSDSLLTGKLSSSDEEYKITVDKKKERKKKRKTKSIWVGSESESEIDDEECETQPDSSSDSSIQFVLSKSKRSTKMCSSSGSVHSISSMSENDDLVSRKKSIKWKRKKRTKIHLDFSSDSSENGSSCEEVPNTLNTSSQSQDMSGKGRRNIRKVMKDDDVTEATRRAIKEEEERKQRVLDRQQKYNDSFGLSEGSTPIVGDRLVLDFDTNLKKELICVDENLVSQMKPHQVQGVKFMWDACFESVEAIKDGEGGGCILAHCMGLGKTFQVVSLVHTLLMHRKETKVRRVLICCPLSTVLNWCSEFQKWLSKLSFSKKIAVHHLANDKTMNKRVSRLKNWHNEGGVMIMGYEMFRSLTNEDKKVKRNYKTIFTETLLEPGADLVICDEGHTLKNLKTSLSQQMNKIQTRRRIVLTGTPLQNNLIEYHCMMNFVKPNYLGTRKEFVNRFVNPITNGQFADSTEQDFRVMKRRAHVLHKMLDGITQRRDYRELMPYLPPKQEYVISIRLTELQISLMKTFLEKVVVTKQLFKDYQSLNRLWSHPLTLKYSMDRSRKKPENDGKVVDIFNAFNDHTNDSDIEFIPNFENEVTVETTEKKEEDKTKEKENADKEEEEWWKKLVSEEQMSDVTVSSKLVLLFAFLKQCEAIGDKMLIFSQSLPSLDVIEFFLNKMVQQINSDKENVQQNSSISHWKKDVDYFRLDGSTSSENREKWTRAFNKPTNRARLFLISTKAGGLGINLTAANRVILFDASWNPSNDIQSIFRVFRFGQDKPCYIYRFIAQGTMEEKIYERQISKLSLAIRVVDEQQVNRYYSQTDLQELYKFTPADPNDRPIPIVPKDRLLCDMLEEHSDLIYKVFMHDSLLDHVEEEELDEEEQRAAWEDYKNEKKNLDRASSLLKVPAHDVEMMEKILIKKYAHIPPETLKEVIAKQVEAWKRSRAAQLTGGALVSGPSTNAPSTSAASAATTSAVSAANVETISLLE